MNCEQFEYLLADALGGELSSVQRAGFDGHVRDCARCRREFESASAAISAMRSLPGPPVATAGFAQDRFDSMVGIASSETRRYAALWRPVLRYAAAIAIAFVAGYVVRAGLAPSILTPGVKPETFAETSQEFREPKLPGVRETLAQARPRSFEAAFAGAHLRDPSRSDLAKCMVAMFGTHR